MAENPLGRAALGEGAQDLGFLLRVNSLRWSVRTCSWPPLVLEPPPRVLGGTADHPVGGGTGVNIMKRPGYWPGSQTRSAPVRAACARGT